jgi:hypothetical protein
VSHQSTIEFNKEERLDSTKVINCPLDQLTKLLRRTLTLEEHPSKTKKVLPSPQKLQLLKKPRLRLQLLKKPRLRLQLLKKPRLRLQLLLQLLPQQRKQRPLQPRKQRRQLWPSRTFTKDPPLPADISLWPRHSREKLTTPATHLLKTLMMKRSDH